MKRQVLPLFSQVSNDYSEIDFETEKIALFRSLVSSRKNLLLHNESCSQNKSQLTPDFERIGCVTFFDGNRLSNAALAKLKIRSFSKYSNSSNNGSVKKTQTARTRAN